MASGAQEQVTVWVADVRERWTSERTSRLLQGLHEADRVRVGRYRQWLDMQMSTAGRWMIATVMRRAPSERIQAVSNEVIRSSTGRPSLPFRPDFNLAHSGGLVVLAVAERASGLRVGIDVEVIADGWADLAAKVLNDAERDVLSAMVNPSEEFYRVWTYKEAVVKADGRGVDAPLNRLSSLGDSLLLDGRRWWLRRLASPPGFAAHLATSREVAIRMESFRLL